MGIFDNFGGRDARGGLLDPMTLLALSASIGEASQPSTTPRSLGPAIGKGAFQAAQLRQQMAQADMQRKMYELQMQKMQRDMARKPERYEVVKDPFGLGGVGQMNTATGKIEGYQKPEKPDATPAMKEAAMLFPNDPAKQMEYVRRARMQAKTQVTTNVGDKYGKPEAGTAWVRNPDGTVKLDDRGVPIAAPYQGGSVMREMKEGKDKEQRTATNRGVTADIVLQDINRAFKVMETATLPTTGLVGGLLSNVGNTAARDLRGLVDTVKANIGFDKLQAMREASKTGGALGQVSEFENKMLQATMGNLEQSQSESQFRYSLNRLKKIYTDIVHHGAIKRLADAGASPEVIDAFIDTTPSQADAPPPPPGTILVE